MKQYKATKVLYLTFLTRLDSYMEKVPAGSILYIEDGDLWYNGKRSIDDQVAYLYHGYIEEIDGNTETVPAVTSRR